MSHVQTGIGFGSVGVHGFQLRREGRRQAVGIGGSGYPRNTTVGWICSTQKIVTLSTTEAEYVALGDGVKEVLFAKSVASFLVPSLSQKTIKVVVDNDGAIKLGSNPLGSARTKYIDCLLYTSPSPRD